MNSAFFHETIRFFTFFFSQENAKPGNTKESEKTWLHHTGAQLLHLWSAKIRYGNYWVFGRTKVLRIHASILANFMSKVLYF